MDYIVTRTGSSGELMHYGVLGMKWGCSSVSEKRRYSHKSWKET